MDYRYNKKEIVMRVKDTESFKIKASLVHNNFYNYDKSIYVTSKEKIIVTCPVHDDFEITPNIHLSGSGCKKCHCDSITLPFEVFTSRANKLYNNKYVYVEESYSKVSNALKAICPTHGEFEIIGSVHLEGSGCKSCRLEAMFDTVEEFIFKANKKHNFKYDYNLVDYKGTYEKVNIVCPVHGSFSQRPNDHLNGSGCPKCVERHTGFNLSYFKEKCIKNNNGLGIFYVLRCFGNGEEFYKIGITSRSVSKRYKDGKLIPYTYEIVYELEASPDVVFELEKELKYTDEYKRYKYTPMLEFDGSSECYNKIIIKDYDL